ncbi:TAXI family TRAP transporter solute-binding subunit [Mycolicibacterium iranicum]|jgi:hypothetical protein|uniref:TAXI family TRAP transporter solute-binding subunit n=1 Tax=Mycolicibacterium iranicum TaxID=912594 RepID=A0ABT4HPK2_MYCIR|nr:TAXI family TRAP transporter solute-binding subunit [Mycolicibacterium iranicum]MCZ0732148.1 TAXI family TRAP transporter solute-binding subunit [Mycolicibacterium iranicum]
MSPLMDRRSVLRGIALLSTAVAVSSCRNADKPAVRLAAGEQGGFFWEFSGLLAAAADRSGVSRLTPLQTGGSVENLEMLRSGDAELAMSLADIIPATADDFAAIGRVYENYFQIAVRDDSPIISVEQLAGRAVSVGAPGSGATMLSERVLATVELSDPQALRRVERPMRGAATELAEGRIDAAMWAGGLPTPAFADLPVDIRLLDLTTVVDALRSRYGTAYEAVSVPAGVYGPHPGVTTVGVANLLLARRDVADPVVAGIVDLLLDDPASLVPAQAIGSQFLDAQSLIQTGSVQLHPGATDEYRRRHG